MLNYIVNQSCNKIDQILKKSEHGQLMFFLLLKFDLLEVLCFSFILVDSSFVSSNSKPKVTSTVFCLFSCCSSHTSPVCFLFLWLCSILVMSIYNLCKLYTKLEHISFFSWFAKEISTNCMPTGFWTNQIIYYKRSISLSNQKQCYDLLSVCWRKWRMKVMHMININ